MRAPAAVAPQETTRQNLSWLSWLSWRSWRAANRLRPASRRTVEAEGMPNLEGWPYPRPVVFLGKAYQQMCVRHFLPGRIFPRAISFSARRGRDASACRRPWLSSFARARPRVAYRREPAPSASPADSRRRRRQKSELRDRLGREHSIDVVGPEKGSQPRDWGSRQPLRRLGRSGRRTGEIGFSSRSPPRTRRRRRC